MNTTKNLSLKDFFGEFLGSIITYDSRFRYTLKDLLFRPGVITRNYVHGQRLKYANPFRFFLSVSIIYFILQSLIATFTGSNSLMGDFNNPDSDGIVKFNDPGKALGQLSEKDSITIDSVFRANNIPADSLWNQRANYNNEQADSIIKAYIPFIPNDKDEEYSYELVSEAQLDTMQRGNRMFKRFELYWDFYKTTNIKSSERALDSLHHDNSTYNRWAYSKVLAFERVEENPSEFVYYLIEKTPFFVFFFTPVYALFFWLLYSKKKYTYMEHMIFIFHIFTFVFLAAMICLIPDTLLDMNLFSGIAFSIIGPFYFYKALRNFYQQIRIITILKFIFLNIVFWISSTIFAMLFFLITAAMY